MMSMMCVSVHTSVCACGLCILHVCICVLSRSQFMTRRTSRGSVWSLPQPARTSWSVASTTSAPSRWSVARKSNKAWPVSTLMFLKLSNIWIKQNMLTLFKVFNYYIQKVASENTIHFSTNSLISDDQSVPDGVYTCLYVHLLVADSWAGYEHSSFCGQQFVLERGEYPHWESWSGSNAYHIERMMSFRPICSAVSSCFLLHIKKH